MRGTRNNSTGFKLIEKQLLTSTVSINTNLVCNIDKLTIINNSNKMLRSILSCYQIPNNSSLAKEYGQILVCSYIILVLTSSTSFSNFLFNTGRVIQAPVFLIQFVQFCIPVSVFSSEKGNFNGKVFVGSPTLKIISEFITNFNEKVLFEIVQGTILSNNGFVCSKNVNGIKDILSAIITNDEKIEFIDDSSVVNYTFLSDLLETYTSISNKIEVSELCVNTQSTSKIGVFKFRNVDGDIGDDLSYYILAKALNDMRDDLFTSFASFLYSYQGKFHTRIGISDKVCKGTSVNPGDVTVNLGSLEANNWSNTVVTASLEQKVMSRSHNNSSTDVDTPSGVTARRHYSTFTRNETTYSEFRVVYKSVYQKYTLVPDHRKRFDT